MLRKRFRSLIITVCALGCFACSAPNQFAEPIGKLEHATNITLEVTQARFGRSLELSRERAYLRAWIEKKSVRGDFINENSGDFPPGFTPATLSARVALIQELKNFSRLLSKVAGSDVDQQFGTAVEATATKLAAIAKQLDPNTEIGNTVTTLGKIVATIGSFIIEGKREEAIRSALRDGSPIIKRLVELLENDLSIIHTHTKTRLDTLVTDLSLAADDELGKSQPGRLEVIMVLSKYNWERLNLPALQKAQQKALDDLEETYGKLEAFEPERDIGTLLGQIETFLNSAFSLLTLWEAE